MHSMGRVQQLLLKPSDLRVCNSRLSFVSAHHLSKKMKCLHRATSAPIICHYFLSLHSISETPNQDANGVPLSCKLCNGAVGQEEMGGTRQAYILGQ